MKVFWSWQSDTPGKTGRFLVRDAIVGAIQKLKQAEDIAEPTERERLDSLHLDQDRQGLPGSPDLADAIFNKIEVATIVIADVTIVGRGKRKTDSNGRPVKGRAFINPNVGIEVGYALKAVGTANLLLVVNAHHGPTEDLPFDLRHKAISLVYSLAEDAQKEDIEAARDKLVSTLVPALRHYTNAPTTTAAQQEIVKQPAKYPPAFFFDHRETLAQIGKPGVDEIHFTMPQDRALYLRLIPTRRRIAPFTPRQLSGNVDELGTLWIRNDYPFSTSNEWGQIVFRPEKPGDSNLIALTQVFLTGEIWGINRLLMRDRPEVKGLILPSLPFEATYFDSLRRYVKFLSKLGITPPILFEAGLAGAKGFSLARDYEISYGPIRQDQILFEYLLRDVSDSSLNDCLLKFFEFVYDHTPLGRPLNDWGFPPGPPRERP
jgi:hypothetical protein